MGGVCFLSPRTRVYQTVPVTIFHTELLLLLYSHQLIPSDAGSLVLSLLVAEYVRQFSFGTGLTASLHIL